MSPAQFILTSVVRVYQWVLSPAKTAWFGPLGRCRFSPSCSQYALEAIQQHGAWRGSWLAARRICRCHPWGGCGHDPVPSVNVKAQSSKLKFNSATSANASPKARPAVRPSFGRGSA